MCSFKGVVGCHKGRWGRYERPNVNYGSHWAPYDFIESMTKTSIFLRPEGYCTGSSSANIIPGNANMLRTVSEGLWAAWGSGGASCNNTYRKSSWFKSPITAPHVYTMKDL